MTTGPDNPASNEDEQALEQPVSQGQTTSFSIWWMAAISTFCAMVVVTIGLVIYERFIRPDIKIATVNIERVLEANQLQFMTKITNPETTEKERSEAYAMARGFGPALNNALEAAQKECSCVILINSAVVLGQQLDLTKQIMNTMGVEDVDIPALKNRFEKSFSYKPYQENGQ